MKVQHSNMWHLFLFYPKVNSHRYIFFLKVFDINVATVDEQRVCALNPFSIVLITINLFKKLILASSLLKALLYWQKAADTMLWWKAYVVMGDGVLKEDRAVQQWRSGERRAPSHSLPELKKRQKINMVAT